MFSSILMLKVKVKINKNNIFHKTTSMLISVENNRLNLCRKTLETFWRLTRIACLWWGVNTCSEQHVFPGTCNNGDNVTLRTSMSNFFYHIIYCILQMTKLKSGLECLQAVWPDWAIYCTLGNFSKPVAAIILPKLPTFLGKFCRVVKIFYFASEIIFGQTFGDFFWSHWQRPSVQSKYYFLTWFICGVCSRFPN